MDWNFLIRNKHSLCVSTDTRNLPTGCVFFALRGERFDANQFAAQALEQGASMAIVSDEAVYQMLCERFGADHAVLLDQEANGRGGIVGLQQLARAWRRELGLPVIGITGTNGKTTTKELTAAVLRTKYRIHYTQGNLNNSIGVPLTLLQLTRDHELAIVEMGASHPGDIRELVEVAEPDYGLITNVGRAHLQGFGSFEGVQQTKRELYDYLVAHGGTIFQNSDNPYLHDMLKNATGDAGDTSRQVGYVSPAEKSRRCGLQAAQVGHCSAQLISYHTGTMPEGTHLVGNYNAENVSAARCVGAYFGISDEVALDAIRAYVPTNNRSQLVHSSRGNTITADSYNANPTSMQAAINAFTGDTYILGAMRELGEYSHLEHQNIVNMLAERKAPMVLLVGEEYAATTSPYPVFPSADALCAYLQEHPISGATILLKGSRSNQMEKALPLL
ncbi:MAG: UDP-N-acetylmuramoyl-tripeptide--D-alanyl-D-alanine ligase [Paludibacteraceae bacterium]